METKEYMRKERRKETRKWITVVFLISVTIISVLAMPASASPNQIWASDEGGVPKYIFGVNEVVYVTGDLDPTPEDFIFPTADIYVVNKSGVRVTKKTIMGTLLGGGFIGEILWLPPLTPGTYDIFVDENRNGIIDGIDIYQSNAFTVTGVGPPPEIDVSKVKADARNLSKFWKVYPHCLEWSFTVIGFTETALSFAIAGWPTTWSLGIALGVTAIGFIIPTSYNAAVVSIGMKIIKGLSGPLHDHYKALADDPPDSNYTEIAELGSIENYIALEESNFVITQTNLANNLAQQDAILQALTKSIERYEGAKAAGNYTYILLQAKAIKKFADMLVVNYRDAVQVLDAYAREVKRAGGNKTIYAADVIAFQQRIATSGFTEQEIQNMKDFGMNDTEIESLKEWIIGINTTGLTDFNEYSMIKELQALINESIPDFEALSANATEVINYYTPLVELHHPVSVPGGPYSGYEGSPITFNGTASTDPDGDLLTYTWDFDCDGEFDDAVGAVVNWTWNTEYSGWVGLRVTDTTGLNDTAWAKVTVLSINSAPVIESFAPISPAPTVNEGDSLVFNVTASDPDGDSMTYKWTLNGVEVSTSDNWTYFANISDSGKFVKVTVTDDSPFSQNTTKTWRIIVKDVTPPTSVSDLNEINVGTTWILWNWTNPPDADFSHAEVWINGKFKENVTAPEHSYNATGLNADTIYEIGIRTVDSFGNVNKTWMNDTAKTLRMPIHDINVSIDYAPETNGIKIKYDGTEISASENLTIGSTYSIYYKIVNEGDYNETVNVTVKIANSTWSQTIATHMWTIKVGKYHYAPSGGDTWDTSRLAPGNYNLIVNITIPIDDDWTNNERIRAVTLALPPNQPPVSDPNGPYTGCVNSSVTLNGSKSYDPDMGDTIVSYGWELDNVTPYDFDDAFGETVQWTWNTPGTYNIGLKVTDKHGATHITWTTVNIEVCLPELCPDEYRWSVYHTPGYEWDPYPDLFRAWNDVHFVNNGTIDAFNVTATITCAPVNMNIVDGTVTLGDIPAGSSAWSKDFFELEVDMTNPQDPNKGICWRVEYDDAYGNHHVIEDVAKYCGEKCGNICP